jgi:hypothetical protein
VVTWPPKANHELHVQTTAMAVAMMRRRVTLGRSLVGSDDTLIVPLAVRIAPLAVRIAPLAVRIAATTDLPAALGQ